MGSRFALVTLLAAGLATPLAAQAGDPIDCKLRKDGKIEIKTVDSPQHCKRLGGRLVPRIYCEIRKNGKTSIQPIPTPQDCSRLGGKVVKKPKVPRGSRSQRPLT